jgi:hypothetical protein
MRRAIPLSQLRENAAIANDEAAVDRVDAVVAHDRVAALRAHRPLALISHLERSERARQLSQVLQTETDAVIALSTRLDLARQQVREIDAFLADLNPEPRQLE